MENTQQLLFGDDFINDHAGRLIHNPDIALVELVANAWDAGATHVNIQWPSERGEEVIVEDDGTGMDSQKFFYCWNHINYNRIVHQGRQVKFPPTVSNRVRFAYGCNGKGRHSMFCFNNEYRVETWCDGHMYRFLIKLTSGSSPWTIKEEKSGPKDGHGTKIYTTLKQGLKDLQDVRQLIGSKFIADPEFVVSVNGNAVQFEEVTANLLHNKVQVPDYGEIEIIKIPAEKGRTAKQHGLAWWVNGRLVGNPGWETLSDHLLDGRKTLAKSMTFIILANVLDPKEDITPDWSAFLPNDRTQKVHEAVANFIRNSINDELRGEHKERKREILESNRTVLRKLSPISQKVITSFIDEVQVHCPTMKDQDLNNTASLLIKLENTRSGYAFLENLAHLNPNDLDGWNSVIEEWTLDGARKVLDELKWRLELINQLEARIEKNDTDELHELQPLFEKGLWIFGPEYEAIEFRSNKSISTVIRDFFGNKVVENPRIRPDFVALPDVSIGSYSCNSYDENGEVAGYGKVAIVELKRGGFEITADEINQANKYAYAISQSGKVQNSTSILCFVLGAQLRYDAQRERTEGNIRIIPKPYNVVLRQAHARTFNLLQKISSIPQIYVEDEELKYVLSKTETEDLFQVTL